MRTIALLVSGAFLTGCSVADLNGLASAGQGSGPELARSGASFATETCTVTSRSGAPVIDGQGNPVLCEP